MTSGSKNYERFDELAEEFARRYRDGEKPNLQEYVDRLPEMAEEIRELFPAFIEVDQLQEARQVQGTLEPPASVAAVAPLGEIGDYRILREVGRGGMGVVYEAEQISLGRRVALKVLPRHVAKDKTTLERFRREARSAARLHHTNIVPVFEVDQDGETVFYAMQFIQGQGLDRVIEELARLRENSAGSTDGRAPQDARRSRRAGQIAHDLTFAAHVSTGPTEDETTTPHDAQQPLSKMAFSLLRGRFLDDLEKTGTDRIAEAAAGEPTVTKAVADAGFARTEAIDQTPSGTLAQADEPRKISAAASSAPPVLPRLSVFVRAQDRRDSRSAQPEFPSRIEAAGSAVLPGGTLISGVDSSGHRRPFFRSVAQIGRQVALGLDYAHARGIVHRDIKPANLLLDTAGVVWITDFGLAKAEDDGLTATGDIVGTLRYMAPERFRGVGDARGDIYALGLTIYELLTLRPAFKASDRLRLIEQIKQEEPVRPRSLDPRIPRDLETIVLKATDKEPARRYASAAALAEDLRRFVDDEAIQARRASYAERLQRWARRHKAIAISLATFFVLLACGLIAASIAAAKFRAIAHDMERLAGEKERERRAALEAKIQADSSRKLAEDEREAALRTLYFAKVNTVSEALTAPETESVLDPFKLSWRGLAMRSDPRAWEWYYLNSPPAHQRLTLRGQPVDVGAVAVSPDGTKIASGGWGEGIRIWDAASGRLLRTLNARPGVMALAWSPDGTRIAEASASRFAQVWDAETGISRFVVPGWQHEVWAIAWNPDGSRLAAAGRADPVALMNPAYRSDPIRIVDGSTGRVISEIASGVADLCAWSPDGKRIASVATIEPKGVTKFLSIWDATTGKLLSRLEPIPVFVNRISWSPTGEVLACATIDGQVKLWDTSAAKLLRVLYEKDDASKSGLAWSRDGTMFAAGDKFGRITVWNTKNWQPVHDFRGGATINALSFLPDGTRIVSGHAGWNGEVRVWSLNSATREFTVEKPIKNDWTTLLPLAWNPVRPTIAVAGGTGKVDLVDTETGARSSITNLVPDRLGALAWSRDGKRLAVGSWGSSKVVKVLDVATGRELASLGDLNFTKKYLDWSPDGRKLLTATEDIMHSDLIVWDGQSYKKERETKGDIGRFSPDGTRIAVTEQYGVKVLSAATFDPIVAWRHAAQEPTLLCWSPDGRFLAGAYLSEGLVWDSATGSQVATLAGHSGRINSVAWSPDGARLATASEDATVRLWDPQSGTPVFTLRGHKGSVLSVDWRHDGLAIASADELGSVRIWDASAGSQIDCNPAELARFDSALAKNPDDASALRGRAQRHARREQWDAAGQDCEHLLELENSDEPRWFQAGWWSSSELPGVSGDAAEIDQVADPFELYKPSPDATTNELRRPRWYCSSFDPNGYVPIGKQLPYMMTRFYASAPQEAALVHARFPLLLWFNGERLKGEGESSLVTLRKGWNTLIAKPPVSEDAAALLAYPRCGAFIRLSTDAEILSMAYLASPEPQRAIEPITRDLDMRPQSAAALQLAFTTARSIAAELKRRGKDALASKEQSRALAYLERLVAARPDLPALRADLVALSLENVADWSVVEPIDMKATGGASLAKLSDSSILASGTNPPYATYTVTAKTNAQRITAIRFDSMNDPSLPRNGPGRAGDGHFHINELEAASAATSRGATRPYLFGNIFRMNQWAWVRQARLQTGDDSELTLTLTLGQIEHSGANLGRFRLSLSTFPDVDLLLALEQTPHASAVPGALKLIAGDPAAACSILEQAQDDIPAGRAANSLLLSLARARRGEPDKARAALLRGIDQIKADRSSELLPKVALVKALSIALKAAPDDVLMIGLRARTLDWMGAWDDAAADFAHAAKLDPGNPVWPQRALQLKPNVINDWNFEFGTESWEAVKDAQIDASSGSYLRVTSSAKAAEIAAAQLAAARKLMLTIRIRLEHAVHARLMWDELMNGQVRPGPLPDGVQQFDLVPTKSAWQNVEVAFRPKANIGRLRLALDEPGCIVDIDSMVLRPVGD
jgi:eukaryotic-like serine/threonine-protein kinase